jgi:hypothetical protein
VTNDHMSDAPKLRRLSETFDFEYAGLAYTATASWFGDGRLAELFLNNHKVGSHADTSARDAAITLSPVYTAPTSKPFARLSAVTAMAGRLARLARLGEAWTDRSLPPRSSP